MPLFVRLEILRVWEDCLPVSAGGLRACHRVTGAGSRQRFVLMGTPEPGATVGPCRICLDLEHGSELRGRLY